MKSAKYIAGTLFPIIFASLAGTFLPGCSKSESGGGPDSGSSPGISGIYTSVDSDGTTIEFKSGAVIISMDDQQGAPGTYTVDGEKIIADMRGQKITFIRDGACIDDYQQMLGRLCKGGRSGAAANVSTRNVPTTPTGTYVATNADGVFKIEFKPGNKFTLSIKPVIGNPETQEATFTVEADTIYANMPQTPMVLKFVNDTYESTSFGLPMKFVKQ